MDCRGLKLTTVNNTRAALNLWSEAVPKVTALLQKSVKLVFPGDSDPYYRWFTEIESDAFRAELRYSSTDLEERLLNEDILFLFFLSTDGPEALLLAYSDEDDPKASIYLDTIAVKSRRKGVGSLLLRTFLDYSKMKGYERIHLDTEVLNDHDQQLVAFYHSFGFREIEISEDGNITMELHLG